MPNKVKVVTAYVDLGLTKRPSGEFHHLGHKLIDACWPHVRVYGDFPFMWCWAHELGALPAANLRAEDRFATDLEHVRSNLIQHSPLQWLTLAAEEDPLPDVFVWLGYSIMKQGDFTGKPVTAAAVGTFLDNVAKYPFGDIPIPSIRPGDPVLPYGDNWQFVGSTIIAPRKFLPQMVKSYKSCLREFVRQYKAIPLDLAIWPAVVRSSGLPFAAYPAEYDRSQLENFPCTTSSERASRAPR